MANINNKMDVHNIIHPGFILGQELKARKLTQKIFANQIAMQQSHLSEIIKGKRNITEQIAVRLEEALSIPADIWMKLQAEYDFKQKTERLANVRDREADVELTEYNVIYDMRTIYLYVGIDNESPKEKLDFCHNALMFGTPSVQRRKSEGLYRRSEKTGLDPRMISTWSVLAKYEASKKPKPETIFSKDNIDELVSELRVIFNENLNTMNRVERTLYKYGIKFCIVPKLRHASVDGYSFVMDDVPSIVVTKRFNRIDNIAFAVMHEVGHLAKHSSEDEEGHINLPYYNAETSIPKEENEANEFAADALIPVELWDSLPPVELNPYTIQKKYTKWAKNNNLNEWIVLGRVSHETGMYMFKSNPSREIK